MSRTEEEYIRRMRALGYEPSLAGMDDEDIEWELARMDGGRGEERPQPTRTVYRPVDPGLAARIFRQMGRPYDQQAISPKQSFYLNGWYGDDEGDGTPAEPMPYRPREGGAIGEPDYYMPLPAPIDPELQRIPIEEFIQLLPAPRARDGAKEADWGADSWATAWKIDWGGGGSRARALECRPEQDGGPVVQMIDEDAAGGGEGDGVTTGAPRGVKLWADENPDWENLQPKMKESTEAFIGEIDKEFGMGKTPWITSGYRSPERNARIPGASPTSWHTQGLGVDVHLGDYTAEERARIEEIARERFDEVLWHDAGTGLHLHIGNPLTK